MTGQNMNKYVVISLTEEKDFKAIEKSLKTLDPSVYDYYSSKGVYFVQYGGTAQQVAELIGFGSKYGSKPGLVIGPFQQYYGFANPDLWNWLNSP
ncbi:MAG: hypothetical protein OXL68_14905 [Paracoccaceae bacterium]|nr:hypothetical protein [Paracoccaceae bacterium]